MSEIPSEDPQLSQSRSEADAILLATEFATRSAAWQRLGGQQQSPIAMARDHLILVKEGDDAIAIRKAVGALDQATRHIAEEMMAAAVQRAIRGES